MEEVYLSSDILFHYFARRLGKEGNVEQAKRAVAVLRRVILKELIAHISDVVVFETVRLIEGLPWEEQPQAKPELDPEAGRIHVRTRFATKRARALSLLYLIQYPAFVGIDKLKWQHAIDAYVKEDLSLEAAYHAATVQRLKQVENREIRGIVSFDEEYDRLEDITRIDPCAGS